MAAEATMVAEVGTTAEATAAEASVSPSTEAAIAHHAMRILAIGTIIQATTHRELRVGTITAIAPPAIQLGMNPVTSTTAVAKRTESLNKAT